MLLFFPSGLGDIGRMAGTPVKHVLLYKLAVLYIRIKQHVL
jgi:hypothetical protein